MVDGSQSRSSRQQPGRRAWSRDRGRMLLTSLLRMALPTVDCLPTSTINQENPAQPCLQANLREAILSGSLPPGVQFPAPMSSGHSQLSVTAAPRNLTPSYGHPRNLQADYRVPSPNIDPFRLRDAHYTSPAATSHSYPACALEPKSHE